MRTDEATFVPAELDLGDLLLLPWGCDPRTEVFAAEVRAAAADPAIARWNPFRPGEDGAEWIAARAGGWAQGTAGSFAILDGSGASSPLLGTVTVRWTDRADGQAMIGYWLLPAARGRGAAVGAVRAVSRWAFGASGARRIELAHAAGNAASCRVAERAGYLLEGTLRASHRYGDGRHHDEHLHARLGTDPEPAA